MANRRVLGHDIDAVLKVKDLISAFGIGSDDASKKNHSYGGLVYATPAGVLQFKGPKEGAQNFSLDSYVKSELPAGTNLVAVWVVHPRSTSAAECRPSQGEIQSHRKEWPNVFYLVITGSVKGTYPDEKDFEEVTKPGMPAVPFTIWNVLP